MNDEHFRLPLHDANRLRCGEITLDQARGIAEGYRKADREQLQAQMADAMAARERNRAWLATFEELAR